MSRGQGMDEHKLTTQSRQERHDDGLIEMARGDGKSVIWLRVCFCHNGTCQVSEKLSSFILGPNFCPKSKGYFLYILGVQKEDLLSPTK